MKAVTQISKPNHTFSHVTPLATFKTMTRAVCVPSVDRQTPVTPVPGILIQINFIL